ncbi:hypothetical protein SESBI_44215 [Sesbania bispinosa]|nr:hypothetical protein SESBI_44215 [Sesbania bispinosa]
MRVEVVELTFQTVPIEVDTWSYFEALGLANDLGYVDRVTIWWKQKGISFKRGLKELKNDEDALELATITETKKCEMEIYLEHGWSCEANMRNVSVPLLSDKTQIENVQVNYGVNEEAEAEAKSKNDTSEDSMRNVHFDDSEEERILDANDGFNHADVVKQRTSSNVKLTEITEDVRKNYNAEISEWKAWKARLYARNIVDGDANHKYTLLWDYSA